MNWTDEANWTPDARAILAEWTGRGGVVAATGHRPPGLGLSYSRADLVRLYEFARPRLRALRPEWVVAGGAHGWDEAVGWAAVKEGTPLLVAVPFAGQAARWPDEAKRRYEHLLSRAARVVTVCPGGYAAGKLFARNHFMVRLAANGVVLACYDEGRAGGTAECVAHARQLGVRVENAWGGWSAAG